MTAINKQPWRHKIEELLPWHATGTLSRRDADRVEQALAGDRELARRYELVRLELADTTRLNEALGAPSARAMERGPDQPANGAISPTPVSHPITTVLILPIIFEPSTGLRRQTVGEPFPRRLSRKVGMADTGVLHRHSGIGASLGRPVRVPHTGGLAS